MGAAQGWLYSAWDFVEQCTECYRWVQTHGLSPPCRRSWRGCRNMASRSSPCSSCFGFSVSLGQRTECCRCLQRQPVAAAATWLPAVHGSINPDRCWTARPTRSNGWTADEVFSRLNDEEFAQVGKQLGCSSLVAAAWIAAVQRWARCVGCSHWSAGRWMGECALQLMVPLLDAMRRD